MIPNDDSRIKDALKRHGVLYAHVKNDFLNLYPINIHAVPLIGYGKYQGEDVFWYHDSYDGEENTSFSRYKAIESQYIGRIFAILDLSWPTFQHDYRNTGFTLLKGDLTENEHEVTWTLEADNTTDFWDDPVIADIDGNIEEGMELIVGAQNFDDTDGRVYALDGKTNNELWSYDNTGPAHSPTIGDVDMDSNKEVLVPSTDRKMYVLNGENGSLQWSYTAHGSDNFFLGSPIVADIDLDGDNEIVFAVLRGDIFYC